VNEQWRGGGPRGFMARVFGEGDNPMRWALPLYRLWGITVKLHVIFIIFIAIELIRSASPTSIGFGPTAIMLACVFGLVLLHEYGHCFACRWVRGEADEIMLWPLGGLAYCRPPHHWKPELITVIGGPGVNVVLLPVLGLATLAVTGEWRNVVFNPFAPNWPTTSRLVFEVGGVPVGAYVTWAVFFLHYVNAALLAFNVLLPMYPMDGGRIVHCLMWRKMGYEKSLWISCNIGFGAAVVLAVLAFGTGEMLLLGIALFGGLTCWQQKQQLKFMGFEPQYAAAFQAAEKSRSKGPSRSQLSAIKKRQEEEARFDRLLDKIAQQGMASLTPRERKFMDRVSEKKRQGRAG
jgi:Zn-dependent protease